MTRCQRRSRKPEIGEWVGQTVQTTREEEGGGGSSDGLKVRERTASAVLGDFPWTHNAVTRIMPHGIVGSRVSAIW
jgi:hypothetical protein